MGRNRRVTVANRSTRRWRRDARGATSAVQLVLAATNWEVRVLGHLTAAETLRFVFFCLVSQNKILTRDNLTKRRELGNVSCLFCSEDESVHHLLFYCIVANQIWEYVSDSLRIQQIHSFLSIGNMWLSNKNS